MPSLVAPLVSGISAAPSGTAEFYSMGTSTLSSLVYSDANGQTAVTSHTLDAYGAIVRYVTEPVDVVVKTAAGATVRTFTWVEDARVVRLESPGFTGPSTSGNGQVVAGGRTTEHAAWGLLYESLGATDGNVDIGPEDAHIEDAVTGITINVVNYGADPSGAQDSTSSITSAMAAATAATGASVYFPPGTYTVTSAITIPENVRVFGEPRGPGGGTGGTKIRQYTDATNGWFTCAVTAADIIIENMAFVSDDVSDSGQMIRCTGSATGGRVIIRNCTFGNFLGDNIWTSAEFVIVDACHFASVDETQDYVDASSAPAWTVSMSNCQFVGTGGSANFELASATHLFLSNCHIYSDTNLVGAELFNGSTGRVLMVGGKIEFAGSGTCVLSDGFLGLAGARIVDAGSGTITITSGSTVVEAGCIMSGTVNLTAASATISSQYRDSRVDASGGNATSYTVNAGNYGMTVYAQTAGAAFAFANPTIDASQGQTITLVYHNTTGGNITSTFGNAYGAAAVAITNNNTCSVWQFVRRDVGSNVKYVCIGPQQNFTP